jgi:glycosyltransferase involved in cell wall biosynthesis
MSNIRVAIDASRVRSGGGIAHLVGILDIEDPKDFGIEMIHLWAYRRLLDVIPDRPWLVKHHPPETEKSLPLQLYWQARRLQSEIELAGCQILFSADASTLCRFQPMVVLSQNMLPYDDGVLALFGWGKDRFQQNLLLRVQKRAFQFAEGVIFLTQHAAMQIQMHTKPLKRVICIAHGVGEDFKQATVQSIWPSHNERPIHCIYVSPIYEYKHQWVVVRAIKELRDRGYPLKLTLVGGGGTRAKNILAKQIAVSDPTHSFVEVLEFLPHEKIASMIAQADIFVFASSCETFGISLLEAMAVGIPIASSNRSSLPETLQDGGQYFDPENDRSIAKAIEVLINSPERRVQLASRAKQLSAAYSWKKCAEQTWTFVAQTYRGTQVQNR